MYGKERWNTEQIRGNRQSGCLGKEHNVPLIQMSLVCIAILTQGIT